MLTTPKDPSGSGGAAAGTPPGSGLDPPDPTRERASLRRAVTQPTAVQELAEAPTGATWATREHQASAAPDSATNSPERASPGTPGNGTVATWLAQHQLGVAVESIGERAARALGVMPAAERAAMSAAVTKALVTSARDHLDRAAAAEIRRTPRGALERACMEALDRQAQLSIDEARRRNSLETAETESPVERSDGPTAAMAPVINVLVTDDPMLSAGDWQAQHLRARVSAHQVVLRRLLAQVEAATTGVQEAPEEQWRGPVGTAGTVTGASPVVDAAAVTDAAPVVRGDGVLLLEAPRSDLGNRRAGSVGARDVVIRGAAALATNLGPHGTVVADDVTTCAPARSPLSNALQDLLQLRATLVAATRELADVVGRAQSLGGVQAAPSRSAGAGMAAEGAGAPPHDQAVLGPDGTSRLPVVEPGRRHLARQVVAQDRLVGRAGEALGDLDADVRVWTRPHDDRGGSPLLDALGRERLHSEQGRFSHVLVLQEEGLATDLAGRHSIVGDSDRQTHLGAAAVSWLLVDVGSGEVVDGGQSTAARTLVTGRGRTTSRSISVEEATPLTWTSQVTRKLALRVLAVVAGLAALIVSLIVLVNLFLT